MPYSQVSSPICISIHAPHEGERLPFDTVFNVHLLISIHAPHEGERQAADQKKQTKAGFQSTLPTRGSDDGDWVPYNRGKHFNPRSPRGGATIAKSTIRANIQFQSTLPTRGSDYHVTANIYTYMIFQSTLPTRGSDVAPKARPRPRYIFQSTLPTRGSDYHAHIAASAARLISIHAPHEGERLCQA